MHVPASTLLPATFDASLESLLATLEGHGEKALVIEYAGQNVRPGYHVTEIKSGSFSTLDCGGSPDSWQETILQIEDLPAENGETHMKVGKFLSILGQVVGKLNLTKSSRR